MKYTIQTNRIYSEDENGKLLAEITFPEIDNGVFCICLLYTSPSPRDS